MKIRGNDSLFYDYPNHVTLAGIFIPVDDFSRSTMYGMSFSETGVESIDSIKSIIRIAKAPNEDEGQRYTTASDYPTIIAESDYVLEVRITGLYVEGVTGNSNTYFCKILDNLRGEELNAIEESGEILISFLKGSVEIGESYIVMINKVGIDSVIYTQSSRNSTTHGDGSVVLAMNRTQENRPRVLIAAAFFVFFPATARAAFVSSDIGVRFHVLFAWLDKTRVASSA